MNFLMVQIFLKLAYIEDTCDKKEKKINTWTHKNFSLIVGHTTPIKNLIHSKEMPP